MCSKVLKSGFRGTEQCGFQGIDSGFQGIEQWVPRYWEVGSKVRGSVF